MTGSLAVAVARIERTHIDGTWFRHSSMRVTGLAGSMAEGRWGPRGAFPVLYLGRPRDSVTVEAYRHLVDAVEDMRPELVAPRKFLTCSVSVTKVVDLRSTEAQLAVGLDAETLASDVGEYGHCQAIARTAHQLGAHGILAPAATGLGETLAIFTSRLPANEMPVVEDTTVWNRLPADPRRLRRVTDDVG